MHCASISLMDAAEQSSSKTKRDDNNVNIERPEKRRKERDKDARANKLPFLDLCKRFDHIWGERKKQSNRATTKQMLDYLLSDKIRNYFGVRYSYYQMLRIIVPDVDLSRSHYGMKEVNIAAAWADALGMSRYITI